MNPNHESLIAKSPNPPAFAAKRLRRGLAVAGAMARRRRRAHSGSRIPEPASRIPHPDPASRIPHPGSDNHAFSFSWHHRLHAPKEARMLNIRTVGNWLRP